MTILYTIGTGSKNGNAELRWSLRSLAKFGRGVDRVCMVGYPPEWVSDSVEVMSVPDVDLPGKKNRSIVNCVLEAVRFFDLKGDFIFACDDVFLSAPVDLDCYPLYVDADGLPTEGGTSFEEMLAATRQFLLSRGAPIFRFQTHAFCRMSADVIRDNYDLLRSTVTDSVRGLEILSLVGNLTLKVRPDVPLYWRKDVKFGADDFREALFRDPKRRGQFSISDKTFGSEEFRRFMSANYGEPCRYERSAS